MLKIGLTGGIGSGKSTVAKIFKILGVPVFDADLVAKKLMNENSFLIETLKKEFGESCYSDGNLNRKYLAEIVFKNQDKLDKLNAIVHPFAIQAGVDWANAQNAPYIIKEAALLFESGSAVGLDFIIGVDAPFDTRISRVIKRDGITKEDILDRMNHQIDVNLKMKRCDFVVLNNEIDLLIEQIILLDKKISAKTQ